MIPERGKPGARSDWPLETGHDCIKDQPRTANGQRPTANRQPPTANRGDRSCGHLDAVAQSRVSRTRNGRIWTCSPGNVASGQRLGDLVRRAPFGQWPGRQPATGQNGRTYPSPHCQRTVLVPNSFLQRKRARQTSHAQQTMNSLP